MVNVTDVDIPSKVKEQKKQQQQQEQQHQQQQQQQQQSSERDELPQPSTSAAGNYSSTPYPFTGLTSDDENNTVKPKKQTPKKRKSPSDFQWGEV